MPDCIWLRGSLLKDTEWHFVTVTSNGHTFVDGVTANMVATSTATMALRAQSARRSFSVANDQDGVGNVNDFGEATGLDVNVTSRSTTWRSLQRRRRHGLRWAA